MDKTKKDYRKEANALVVKIVNGREHVLIPMFRESKTWRDPDYLNTGMALTGVINEGETFQEFKERWIESKENIDSIVYREERFNLLKNPNKKGTI